MSHVASILKFLSIISVYLMKKYFEHD